MGKVQLVAITKGVGDLDGKMAEDIVSYVARVSNPSNQNNFETAPKLLKYLIDHQHWSPFEHVFMTLEIETTRAISPQLLRHRSFCLSGDTELTFELPSSVKKGSKSSYKKTIKEMHDKLHIGAKPIPKRALIWDISKIDPNRDYTPRELGDCVGISSENMRTLCQKNRLIHEKKEGLIKIKGSNALEYVKKSNNTTLTMPLIDKVKQMRIRSFNEETKEFEITHIKNIWTTGIKPVFKLTTANGYELKCTDDHPLLAQDGSYKSLKEALDLKITKNGLASVDASKTLVLATNGIPVYHSREWLENQKNQNKNLNQIADAAGCSIHAIRKWLKSHGLQFTKKEVAERHQSWNKGRSGYKVAPRTAEQKEYMRSITPKGSDHHVYRGGSGSERKAIANFFNPIRKEIFSNFNYICQMCSGPFGGKKIDLHHILEVSTHPELAKEVSNIVPVHRSCHMAHRGKTYDYKALRKTHKGNTLTVAWSKVTKVEYLGEELVYDIEVESPFHNFVANGIVVHNCFQEFSLRYSQATEFVVEEPRRQDVKNRQNSIDDLPAEDMDWFLNASIGVNVTAEALYQEALRRGIAKESARALLPMSTKTKLYMTGSVRSWVHYVELRSDKATQLEHRRIALAAKRIFNEQFPATAAALGWIEQEKEESNEKQ